MSASKQPVPASPTPMTMALPTNILTVNLRMPEPFTGDRMAFKSFMQDCFLYRIHHEATFNTDKKKIIFILLHITGGTARAWKESWLNKKIALSNLGTFKEFKMTLNTMFTALDKGGHALATLQSMRQKKGELNKYIAQFMILAGQSGLSHEKALAEYYMEGIQPDILKNVFQAGPIPKTMEEWYTETS